jgi:hypothetical protein
MRGLRYFGGLCAIHALLRDVNPNPSKAAANKASVAGSGTLTVI